MHRVAILPAEILIDNSRFSWLTFAGSLVIQHDLATSRSIVPFFAKDQSAAYLSHAVETLRIAFEERNGRIHTRGVLTDLTTQRNRQIVESEGDQNAGVLPCLDQLAKQLDPRYSSQFSTRNDQALRAFTKAAETTNAQQRIEFLQEAVHTDPYFGLARIALLETLPQASLAPTEVVQRFTDFDRVRYRALATRLNHDSLTARANAEQAVVNIAPNDIEALGQLGWARFLQSKPSEGEQLLQRAIRLDPTNAALKLQLIEGYVASRRFAEAIHVLQMLVPSNPNLLPALAALQILNGNIPEGDRVFEGFIQLLPANSQLRSSAQSQWKAILNKSDPPGIQANRPTAEGYRSFLEGNFHQAVSFWQGVLQQSGGADLRARTMLASSLRRIGQIQQAAQITVMPFLPEFNDPYGILAFNEMRRLLKL